MEEQCHGGGIREGLLATRMAEYVWKYYIKVY